MGRRRTNKSGQRGVVFLALVLILFVTGSTIALGVLNNRQSAALRQNEEVVYQLELAKQALLNYALNADTLTGVGPGHFPCPDRNNDGTPDAACDPSATTPREYIGRLPQYVELPTLNLSGNPLRYYFNDSFAGIDQQFWYAVSPAFLDSTHANAASLTVNTMTSGTLTLDGTGGIVALVIAPGAALGQDRAANPNDYAQYLEGGNGSGLNFVSFDSANPTGFNDTILAITRDEVITAATHAAVRRVRERLTEYRQTCGTFPRLFLSASCGFNFSGAATNFRSVIDSASGNAPAWLKSSGTGREDWTANGVATYVYTNTNDASISFTGCNMAFDFTYNTGTGTTTVTSTGASAC